jgi:hypothetical protein
MKERFRGWRIFLLWEVKRLRWAGGGGVGIHLRLWGMERASISINKQCRRVPSPRLVLSIEKATRYVGVVMEIDGMDLISKHLTGGEANFRSDVTL